MGRFAGWWGGALFFLAGSALGQTYTWKNVTFPAGGYVAGVEYSHVQSGLVYARTDMGGAYRWDNGNQVWVPLTDWLRDWNLYGIESIAPDPVNANVVYAAIGQTYNGTNGFLIASNDQGNTWTQYNLPALVGGNNDGRNAGERLAVDPNLTSILFFGSRSNGLLKSVNSAANWVPVTSFPVNGDAGFGLSFVIFDPRGGAPGTATQTIYVGVEAMNSGNSNLYRSTNGGTSWTLIPGGPANRVPPHASLGSDGNLWINYDAGYYGPNGITSGQVWKLNTATLAWTQITNLPASGGGYGGICVDQENPQHVIVSTLDWWNPDKIWGTVNGGAAWTTVGNSGGANQTSYNANGVGWIYWCGNNAGSGGWMGDVEIDPFNSNNAIYTTGQGVYSTTSLLNTPSAAITWAFTDYGLEETAVLDMTTSVKGGMVFSAVRDITGMRSTDPTRSPTSMYCPRIVNNTSGVDFAENASVVVRVGDLSPWGGYSTDNGATWTPFTTAPPGTHNQISVSADGTIFLWAPSNQAPSYSTNNGASWNGSAGLPGAVQVESDRVNDNFYAVSGNTLYVSTNGGVNFNAAGTFGGGLSWANRPRAVFGVAGEVWVPTSNGLYRFTNVGLGAVTTAQIANVSNATAVGFGRAAPGQTHPTVYLVGTVNGTYGFFRCDDGVGTAWTRVNDNQHQFGSPSFCAGDEQVYGRIYLGTNGRGILYGDLASVSTPTPTVTLTATATNSRTATPTATYSMTPSSTASRTPTATSTMTGTASLTATPSSSPTKTPTLTMTATSTYTSTATPTSTATRAATSSSTVTNTLTTTPTLTSTGTLTFTMTTTPTSTLTATRTFSFTPTATTTLTPTTPYSPTSTSTAVFSPTATFTRTGISTATSTPTSTASGTPTFTSTSTPSLTWSPTPSPTNSFSPTSTFTAVFTPTLTPSWTPTFTPTTTWTPTPTWTSSFSPTSTFSPTPVPQKFPVIYPNPVNGPGPVNVRLPTFTGPCDVRVQVYTLAFRKVQENTYRKMWPGQDCSIPMTDGSNRPLANGLYYVVVTTGEERSIGKMLILR